MTRYETIRINVIRVIALALLAVSAAFTFPESHYSLEKTFIKSPAPQSDVCSLLADDVEDSDDCSMDSDFFHGFVVSHIESSLIDIVSAKMRKAIAIHTHDAVYLRLRQLLI